MYLNPYIWGFSFEFKDSRYLETLVCMLVH